MRPVTTDFAGARARTVLAGAIARVLRCIACWRRCARAVILPASTIDGPERGHRGLRRRGDGRRRDRRRGLPQARRRGHARVRLALRRAAAGWRRSGSTRKSPTRRAGRGSAPPNGGELIVVWATPFATREGKPVYELLGSELGPGGESFGPRDLHRLQHRRSDRHQPGPRGQLERAGRCRLPGRPATRDGRRAAAARATSSSRSAWPTSTASGGRTSARSTATPRPRCGRPRRQTRRRLAIGPDRQGGRRMAGAGRRRRRADLGEAPVRQRGRLRDAGECDHVQRGPDQHRRGRPERRLLPPRDRPRSPTVSRGAPARRFPGRASSSTSCPMENPRAEPSSKAPASSTRASAAARRRVVGPPSIDIDEQQGMRLLYDGNGDAEGDRRGRQRNRSLGSQLGPPFAGSEPFAVSVMDPQGGGVSAWPSEESPAHPAVAVREDFPDGAVQTALVSGGAGGEVGELSVGRSGLGDGIVAFRQGEFGNAAIVAAAGDGAAGAVRGHRPERVGEALAGDRLLAAGPERGGPAHLQHRPRRPRRADRDRAASLRRP